MISFYHAWPASDIDHARAIKALRVMPGKVEVVTVVKACQMIFSSASAVLDWATVAVT